jgi:predicted unusual protein kinase regulating ubiquinone biosynthesis (AarF/ABC1/UbiB family)
MSENPKKKSPKTKDNSLSRIKSGTLSRGFSLAKMSLNVGAKAAGHAIGGMFSGESSEDRLTALLTSQLGVLSRELGQLKGSVMKVGQMLSVYGEYFLPPEANALLKSLQNQSPPLQWREIKKVLLRELGAEKLAELEISHEPLASASLGQVHRAVRKSDGLVIALKVQYPGVDQAIEGDLKVLKYVLSVSKMIPKGPQYDQIFDEVREMLHQEVDYAQELKLTEEFREFLADDPRFVVPRPIAEFSSRKVLATTLEEGLSVDSPEVQQLSQERRNDLSRAVLELYLKELFEFGAMQTDPHFGNYRIRLGGSGDSKDQLILFDFGAVRKFSPAFLTSYRDLVDGSVHHDRELVNRAATDLGFMQPGDSNELRNSFASVCELICEPFQAGIYNWGEDDLPKRAARESSKLAFQFRLRPPPREIVFLDRKMGGVFIFLSHLKAKIEGRALIESYLELQAPGR